MNLTNAPKALDFSPGGGVPREGTAIRAPSALPPRIPRLETGVTGWESAMAKVWMPGAERIDGGTSRTAAGAGAPRAVWTVTGSDPRTRSAREEARRLIREGRTTHLVWNPVSGEIVQLLAATRRGALPLGGTPLERRLLDHGDEGRVCLVVAVVATEPEPFTDGPMVGLDPLLAWLDSWGVSRHWPAGAPGRRNGRRPTRQETTRAWSRGGHFGHDQVPGSVSTAPGHISPERVATGERVIARVPESSPASGEHPEHNSLSQDGHEKRDVDLSNHRRLSESDTTG
ncbi:hypothetical protein B005_3480 [Nocardiopsis alba ATCC BAA-2165]|uniref:Uncharacterized protein n=2 Tax=Nocardiopsis alba TaxID=53437 RepID=J7KZ86_NOCAA|nr:hypothetical protein B005_3480 [Nocardiopsis alba ATCC BAA-2165]